MTVHVSVDFRFLRYRGAIYTDVAFPYNYWREYLDVFDRVCPIARVRDVTVLPDGCRRADGDRVRFVPITNYIGLWSVLKRVTRVLGECWNAVDESEALLLRWGLIGLICGIFARLRGKPHAFEFVGDAGDAVRQVRNIQVLGLNHAVATLTAMLCRWLARGACCVSYVSRYTQGLYPSGRPDREWIFSGVQLGDGVITAPRPASSFRSERPHIVAVGRLEAEKGHAVMLESLALLRREGFEFRAVFAGPGRELEPLKQRARELGLANILEFPGRVEWGPPLFSLLDDADLFVIPSLTEGMSRALIEALARGVPAIGSSAGGNAELLAPSELAPPGDSRQLAQLTRAALSDPQRLADMSRRGFERVREYHPEEMRRRKHAFWNCLKDQVARSRAGRTVG